LNQLPSSYLDFPDWQEQGNLFEGMSMLDGWGGNLTGGEAPSISTARASPSTCCPCCALVRRLAGTSRPKKRARHDHVVMLSHGLWQRRFGGDLNVVGRQIQINGETYRIQGVMGKDFAFPKDVGLPDYFSFEKDRTYGCR